MTQVVGFLLFLVLAQDSVCAYNAYLGAPLGWANDLLLKPTPISVRPFDLIMLVVFIASSLKADRKSHDVAPMRNTLLFVLATTVAWFAFGVVRGGDARSASWQTYLILSMVLLAFTVAATFRKPTDFQVLAKWLIVAATYRAAMCWLSFFTWGRNHLGESGAFLTSHDDTILWVVSILILIVNAVDKRSLVTTARNGALILLFLGAIQFNSRRLAWVSLAMGLAVLYFLYPQGAAKRRINRGLKFAAPFVLLYVVVGWGRPQGIFLPLRSLSSVSTQEDTSTLARNAENLGLIATVNATSVAYGSGWGKPYYYLTMKYDISAAFALWRYIPHNSILGLLAFTGVLGFAGFWLAIPTAMFLNARVARLSNDRIAKNVALIGASQMVVCANQLYGDMGIFSPQAMYLIAVSYAMALRLPRSAAVWGPAKARPRDSRPVAWPN